MFNTDAEILFSRGNDHYTRIKGRSDEEGLPLQLQGRSANTDLITPIHWGEQQ
jgi:hypothetical protein